MGNSFSSAAGPDEDLLNTVPLPDPQIIDSSISPARYELNRNTAITSPPMNISLTRLVLQFGIGHELKVDKENDIKYRVSFSYFSKRPIEATISIGFHATDSSATLVTSLNATASASYECVGFPISFAEHHRSRDERMILRMQFTDGEDERRLLAVVEGSRVTIAEHVVYIKSEQKNYDLLTLFSSDYRDPSSVSNDNGGNGSCVVCLSSRANIGFLPCRHICVCEQCASMTMRSSSNHCPICRSTATGQIQIG